MQPDRVLGLLRTLGGDPGRVLVVGCEPAHTDPGIGLSPAVNDAVARAVPVVRDLVERHLSVARQPVSVGEEGS
jgi:hydrogenase maturation protease